MGSFGKATEERWGKRRIGEVIGALPVIGAMGLAIGYSVLMGWIFKYTKLSITGELFSMGQDMDSIVGLFNETAPTTDTLGQAVGTMLDSGVFGIGNAWWIIIAVAVSVLIMAFGVSGGIEKACKVMIPILFVLFILVFRAVNSTSVIDAIYILCSYTYGPLLGLFAFGLFTRWQIRDQYVPWVAIASPIICGVVDFLSQNLWQYKVGYELLMLNGALTFLGLYLLRKPAGQFHGRGKKQDT